MAELGVGNFLCVGCACVCDGSDGSNWSINSTKVSDILLASSHRRPCENAILTWTSIFGESI